VHTWLQPHHPHLLGGIQLPVQAGVLVPLLAQLGLEAGLRARAVGDAASVASSRAAPKGQEKELGSCMDLKAK